MKLSLWFCGTCNQRKALCNCPPNSGMNVPTEADKRFLKQIGVKP